MLRVLGIPLPLPPWLLMLLPLAVTVEALMLTLPMLTLRVLPPCWLPGA